MRKIMKSFWRSKPELSSLYQDIKNLNFVCSCSVKIGPSLRQTLTEVAARITKEEELNDVRNYSN